jgi:hypothetical protein
LTTTYIKTKFGGELVERGSKIIRELDAMLNQLK